MKKMKMVIPALALAASMSMTAFAAGEAQQGQAVDTASSNLFEAGTASTQVKVVYTKDVSQLSATVPLSITFAVLSTGEFITPEGYGITNNSVVPIHVSEIKVSDIAEGYEFVTNEDEVSGKKIRLQMNAESSGDSRTCRPGSGGHPGNWPGGSGHPAAAAGGPQSPYCGGYRGYHHGGSCRKHLRQ